MPEDLDYRKANLQLMKLSDLHLVTIWQCTNVNEFVGRLIYSRY